MSILVVGASHRTAPLELLERLALDSDGVAKLRALTLESEHVAEALVLATCNRIEVYAEVDRFHGSVDDVTALLAEHAGVAIDSLLPSLYVHYDEAAVAHLFEVATGLDSMVVGETQILGQVRDSLRHGQGDDSVGTAINSLFQQGLRVGKRAHSETDIDRAGQSVVSVALDEVAATVRPLDGATVVIVGAGAIANLAAASVRRRGAGRIIVTSRTPDNAAQLAQRVAGESVPLDRLAETLVAADLLISCTASTGAALITVEMVEAARSEHSPHRPTAFIDLALPRDIEPEIAELPDVSLIALQALADSVHNGIAVEDVVAVRAIVAEEVAAFAAARAAARVAPTVVALRSMATGVVSAELERLFGRVGDLTPEQRDEVSQSVRRVADKLLHEPTVRVKQLVGRSPESSYADALAELFALDPAAVEAVTRPGDPA